MLVIDGVIYNLAFLAERDQPCIAQEPELVGNRGLAHAKDGCYITDTEFFLGKGKDYLDPGGVPQQFKGFGQAKHRFPVKRFAPQIPYRFFMDTVNLTNIVNLFLLHNIIPYRIFNYMNNCSYMHFYPLSVEDSHPLQVGDKYRKKHTKIANKRSLASLNLI